ncbi:hypothetical protein BC936DRAFT_147655 [Jimgerdemannia flammicorona]|uniref:DNA mismatch repair protein S5 domain-containing protein n=1 Tax=Jimgerdemannia flammicorona TaxID=994334 RepID=A0A433D4S3_9FUNG|nr:hypothetical protein BC936DRAFT_147655 [Jimgerdemannia flammicorona]
MAHTIHHLQKDTIRHLNSGQVIVNVDNVVKELVENAIDANATSIEVKLVGHGLASLVVKDNGVGIRAEDRPNMAKRYYTSKLSSFEDLMRVASYGFRGEALNSICAISQSTQITTRTALDPIAMCYDLDKTGAIISSKAAGTTPTSGTTVTVHKLFHNLPVRRQTAPAITKRIQDLLVSYSLVRPNIRFALRQVPETAGAAMTRAGGGNTAKEDWVKPAADAVVEVVKRVFGGEVGGCVGWWIEGDVEEDGVGEEDGKEEEEEEEEEEGGNVRVRVEAVLAKADASPIVACRGDRVFIYVNDRPVSFARGEMKQVVAMVREKYGEVVGGRGDEVTPRKTPFIFLNFKIPPSSYDVNVEPSKNTVLFHYPQRILDAVEKLLDRAYGGRDKDARRKGTGSNGISANKAIAPGHTSPTRSFSLSSVDPTPTPTPTTTPPIQHALATPSTDSSNYNPSAIASNPDGLPSTPATPQHSAANTSISSATGPGNDDDEATWRFSMFDEFAMDDVEDRDAPPGERERRKPVNLAEWVRAGVGDGKKQTGRRDGPPTPTPQTPEARPRGGSVESVASDIRSQSQSNDDGETTGSHKDTISLLEYVRAHKEEATTKDGDVGTPVARGQVRPLSEDEDKDEDERFVVRRASATKRRPVENDEDRHVPLAARIAEAHVGSVTGPRTPIRSRRTSTSSKEGVQGLPGQRRGESEVGRGRRRSIESGEWDDDEEPLFLHRTPTKGVVDPMHSDRRVESSSASSSAPRTFSTADGIIMSPSSVPTAPSSVRSAESGHEARSESLAAASLFTSTRLQNAFEMLRREPLARPKSTIATPSYFSTSKRVPTLPAVLTNLLSTTAKPRPAPNLARRAPPASATDTLHEERMVAMDAPAVIQGRYGRFRDAWVRKYRVPIGRYGVWADGDAQMMAKVVGRVGEGMWAVATVFVGIGVRLADLIFGVELFRAREARVYRDFAANFELAPKWKLDHPIQFTISIDDPLYPVLLRLKGREEEVADDAHGGTRTTYTVVEDRRVVASGFGVRWRMDQHHLSALLQITSLTPLIAHYGPSDLRILLSKLAQHPTVSQTLTVLRTDKVTVYFASEARRRVEAAARGEKGREEDAVKELVDGEVEWVRQQDADEAEREVVVGSDGRVMMVKVWGFMEEKGKEEREDKGSKGGSQGES